MENYKNSYEVIVRLCSDTVSPGPEIKKILKTLTDIQVIECCYYILAEQIINQNEVYILVNAAAKELDVKEIAEQKGTKGKLAKYSELLEKKQTKKDVAEMFVNYRLLETPVYYASQNVSKVNMPRQGWIINISARGYEDYRRVVLAVVPELIEMKACFRVLKPNFCKDKTENIISIYTTCEFNFDSFSEKTQLMLLENVNKNTDKYIFGRLSAIFQNFFGSHIIDKSGNITNIVSGVVPNLPKEIHAMDILNYHESILQNYKKNKNLIQYFQEYLIGLHCFENKIFYNLYLIKNADVEKVLALPIMQETKDINAICRFKVDIREKEENEDEEEDRAKKDKRKVFFAALLVHNDYNDDVVRTLIKEEIKYEKYKNEDEIKEELEELEKERRKKAENINKVSNSNNSNNNGGNNTNYNKNTISQKEKDRREYEAYEKGKKKKSINVANRYKKNNRRK